MRHTGQCGSGQRDPSQPGTLNRIEGYTKQQVPLGVLPTKEEINERREQKLIKKMEIWLERDRCKREEEIVGNYISAGYDPAKVAAAALKLARVEEKQRPIEKIGEVSFEQRTNKYDKRRSSAGKGKGKNYRKQVQRHGNGKFNGSHEKGMVRLNLSHGRIHGVSPSEVVGAIASRANIPGYVIGKILIRDQHTLVDVPENYVSRVLGQTGSYTFREHHNVTIERARV